MFKTVILIIIILISVLALAGVQKYRGKPTAKPTITPSTEIMTQDKLIEKLSKEKLADYLKIDVNQIEIVKVEKVDWPDASLGAPEQEMMYAQVITPGYKVTMMAGSVLYEAHTDLNGQQIVLVKNGERLK